MEAAEVVIAIADLDANIKEDVEVEVILHQGKYRESPLNVVSISVD